jgi:erythromycin esterase
MKKIIFILLIVSISSCRMSVKDVPVSLDTWIENNAFEIKEVTLDYTNQYSFLNQYIKDKQIIAVGEATHGTSEFFQIKNQIFKYLVEHHGFEVYGLESGYYETQKINEYVTNGIGNPEQLILSLNQWCWNTWEFVELIKWMRNYNLTNSQKLKFYGFDIGNTIWHSKDDLRNKIIDKAPELKDSYDSVIKLIFDKKQKPSEVNLVLKKFEKEIDASSLSKNTKFLIGLYRKEYESWKSKKNSRDLYMSEIINDIYLRQEDEKKMFLSMHNYHLDKSEKYLGYLGKTDSTYVKIPDRTTGFYLKKQYEKDYYAIAFEFNKGKFNAPYKLDKEKGLLVKPFEFEEAPDSLFAYQLSKYKKEKYFLNINENIKEFHEINKMHQFGGFLPRRRNTNDIKLKDSYDAIIFVNTSTPSKRIK